MRIGLVYDLREDYLAAGYGEEETAEFDQPGTIQAIELALRTLGHETERVGNLRPLAAALTQGQRWDLVFNVAEGLSGVGREAQVPGLLEAFDVPYTFSDPLVCALTLHKALTKRVLRDLGIPTADFAVVERAEQARDLDLGWPVFVKPLAEGTAKGIDGGSRVETPHALEARCRTLMARYRQPALVEPYLPGREVTVGLLGSGERAKPIGTLEVSLRAGAEPHAYSYVNKERSEELCEYRLAEPVVAAAAEALALRTWIGLGCRDGGRVDLRADGRGQLQVLELNPLPGLHPTHSDLPILCDLVGIGYTELIQRIVESASERVPR